MLSVFDEQYKKLNPAQKKAVDTIEGPVMVIAGPGTGKTSILTLRIANILKKTDTPASGILAITFTDAGVKAMKGKLREIIDGRADEVRIHTFHGFASAVIAEFRDHFTHLEGFEQITDIEAETLLIGILEDPAFSVLRPLGKPDFYLGSILSSISEAKRETSSPQDVRSFAEKEIERIKSDESLISTRGASKGELKAEAKKSIERLERTIVFSEVYQAYENAKKEKRLMDFDDLIFELILALGRDELLLRLLQEKFLYLFVDEHQDTNDSQNLIIKILASFFDSPNVFIVGDEKQAIYRFQGASIKNFLRFEKTWPAIEVISLEENYRSHQHILDATFGMIEKNYADGADEHLRIKLKSGNMKETKPIDVCLSPDTVSSEIYLIEQIKKISEENPEKTIAMISRTNRDVDRTIRLLEVSGIKVSAERSIDIFSHPVGALFFSLIGFFNDPLDMEGLSKSLFTGLFGVDFAQSVEYIKLLRKGNIEEVIKKIPILSEIKKIMVEDSPIVFLIRLAEMSGFNNLIAKDPSYVEVWRGILGLAEQLVRQKNIDNPAVLLEKLIAYKISSERRNIKIKIGSSDAKVKAMTAHGSKGLEFDYVFIPYAVEESWLPRKRPSFFILPISNLIEEGDEIRDARRLFYVALTRAREHAVIISSLEDSGNDLLTSLRFIDELDQDSIKRQTIPKAEKDITENIRTVENGTRIIEYAKETLMEKGLSVTALNHFIKCPSEFILKSILKIPELPAASAEKGNAMHLAFDRIWSEKEENRTEETIQEIIKDSIRDSLHRSFLARFEKEAITTELLKNAPAVAKSLLPHFHTKGEVHTEEWSEIRFENIILHGKLDAVIDTGNDVLVFDYKTRGRMSENEIKGVTKNSDGGYFRQLVFYKMLLESQHKFQDKNIIPSLVFLTPDEKGECKIQTLEIADSDIETLKGEIRELIESVWSGKIINERCDDPKCEWCALMKTA